MTKSNVLGDGGISRRERQRYDAGGHQEVRSPLIRCPMKYAICNMMFGNWPFDRAFAFARQCGYTGIEIAPFTIGSYATEISAVKRIEVRRQADKAGLEVVGLHQSLAKTEGLHLTTNDADVRRKTAQYLGELARLCRDLGGSLVVLGSPLQRNRQPGVTLREAMRNAAEVIQAALPELEQHNVVLALEPLGPDESNFLVTTAEGLELMRMVDSSYCRLLLDCKGMVGAGESVPDTVRKNHQHMVHFHANDPNRQGPGFGKLDFRPIMATLHEIGWPGWVSVEAFDFSVGIERLARESIQNLKAAANGWVEASKTTLSSNGNGRHAMVSQLPPTG